METKDKHISVGGVLDVEGNIEFGEIEVGRSAKIRGSAKGRRMRVGGGLKVDNDALIEDRLQVGGAVDIGGELKTGKVEVGGSLKAEACFAEMVEVGGKVETGRGVKAKMVEIGKGGRVVGPIVGGHVKIGAYASAEDIYASQLELGENSSTRNIYAGEACLNSGCKVTGELLYTNRLEVEQNVKTRLEPRKVEKLPDAPI